MPIGGGGGAIVIQDVNDYMQEAEQLNKEYYRDVS